MKYTQQTLWQQEYERKQYTSFELLGIDTGYTLVIVFNIQ